MSEKPVRFRIVFQPEGQRVYARIHEASGEDGHLALAGVLTFRVEAFRPFVEALKAGSLWGDPRVEVEVEPSTHPKIGRCSLCGSKRVANDNGTWGACTNCACRDPLHDVRREAKNTSAA